MLIIRFVLSFRFILRFYSFTISNFALLIDALSDFLFIYNLNIIFDFLILYVILFNIIFFDIVINFLSFFYIIFFNIVVLSIAISFISFLLFYVAFFDAIIFDTIIRLVRVAIDINIIYKITNIKRFINNNF